MTNLNTRELFVLEDKDFVGAINVSKDDGDGHKVVVSMRPATRDELLTWVSDQIDVASHVDRAISITLYRKTTREDAQYGNWTEVEGDFFGAHQFVIARLSIV